MAPAQDDVEHVDHSRIHEGFAAGECNDARCLTDTRGLIQQANKIGGREVAQSIVERRGLDVAIRALDVAKRARVHPQRIESAKANCRSALAFDCSRRVFELSLDLWAAVQAIDTHATHKLGPVSEVSTDCSVGGSKRFRDLTRS